MTIEIGLLFAAIASAIGLAGFFGGRLSAAKMAGIRDGAMDTNIKYLKDSIDDVKNELRAANLGTIKHITDDTKKRVDNHDKSIERIHARIDDLNKRAGVVVGS